MLFRQDGIPPETEPEVEYRHTSETCAACGHVDAASRHARAFKCVACGHADHADLNAARIIRRRGPALLHGEERSGLPTSVTLKRIGVWWHDAAVSSTQESLKYPMPVRATGCTRQVP